AVLSDHLRSRQGAERRRQGRRRSWFRRAMGRSGSAPGPVVARRRPGGGTGAGDEGQSGGMRRAAHPLAFLAILITVALAHRPILDGWFQVDDFLWLRLAHFGDVMR